MRRNQLPVFTNLMHCPWFLKPKAFHVPFLHWTLLVGLSSNHCAMLYFVFRAQFIPQNEISTVSPRQAETRNEKCR